MMKKILHVLFLHICCTAVSYLLYFQIFMAAVLRYNDLNTHLQITVRHYFLIKVVEILPERSV